MTVSELLFRITLSFITLFIMTRIMGRKEISQMTFFNFVSAIAIGSIAANIILSPNVPFVYGAIALVAWAMFTLAMGFIDIKSKTVRKLTTGEPVIVIKDGQLLKKALRNVRLNINSLNAMLRDKNIYKIADVDYAILETNGKLSVLKKETKQPLVKEDLKTFKRSFNMHSLSTEVISDGQIIYNNLKKLHLDTDWLNERLNELGIDDPAHVFYAEVQPDGSLHINQRHFH
ncbi:YetF domain-containing protein [Virgibacillus sp. W0181]|uniref:YetF domain-containing protein n=1 Tax=Virgibacillus sp. W0181 TaxID=3391581 RepID=UPI003F479062